MTAEEAFPLASISLGAVIMITQRPQDDESEQCRASGCHLAAVVEIVSATQEYRSRACRYHARIEVLEIMTREAEDVFDDVTAPAMAEKSGIIFR